MYSGQSDQRSESRVFRGRRERDVGRRHPCETMLHHIAQNVAFLVLQGYWYVLLPELRVRGGYLQMGTFSGLQKWTIF